MQGCFNTFPPKTIQELESDVNENLAFFLPHIKSLGGMEVTLDSLPNSDYYAIVFWNNYMIGPSKKLIKQLKKYQTNYPSKNTFFLFVYNQNAFIWNAVTDTQKNELLKQLQLEN